jgi:Bacterial regulatory proteins, tetR family
VKYRFVNNATWLRYYGRVTVPDFQRARSAAAKQLRESAILEAARVLGAERGIRQITLTEIAEAVGMHKSALRSAGAGAAQPGAERLPGDGPRL